jgi:Cu-processing system permease protein
MFTVMYYYNSREFTELLVAQPIRRRSIFAGQFLGISLSLSICILLGIGIPFLIFGTGINTNFRSLLSLIFIGIVLTLIFSTISYNIALRNENRIRGFSYALLFWLFFAVIYDGIFLIALMAFRDYPLDNLAIGATVFNPIDLSRIFLMLQMETSALMGYTGAVFKKFFQADLGMIVSFIVLLLWVLVPIVLFLKKAERKDF